MLTEEEICFLLCVAKRTFVACPAKKDANYFQGKIDAYREVLQIEPKNKDGESDAN